MSEEVATIREAGFRLLYETGRPVPLSALASASGYSVEQVEEILASPALAGRLGRDSDMNLAGIVGLSVEPTRHEIRIGDERLWTWCALDAVGIFSAMKASGTIYSTPPDGSETVEIHFDEGAAKSDRFLFLLEGFDGVNSFESWCPNVNFFVTKDDAVSWVEKSGLAGDVVTIGEISERAGEIWSPVVAGLRRNHG